MPPKTSGVYKRGRCGIGKGRGKGRGRSRSPSMSEATHDATEPPAEPQLETAAGRTEAEVEAEVHDSGDDTDVSSMASASKKNKKMKVVADLSPEEEQTMVEWLEAHPIFYNNKMTSYKDTAKKERMWMEKAAEMGKPDAALKTWYTSLRSRFGRLKNKKSCDEDAEMTERDEWVIRHFDFLRPFVHEVQKKTTVSMKQKLAATCAVSVVAEEVDDNPDQPLQPLSTITRPAQPTATASSTPRLRTQKQISEAEVALLAGLEVRGHKIVALQQQVLDQLRPSADRERDAFVDWARSVINELDHSFWRRCQQDISNSLYRYIGEYDQLKRKQAPAATSSTRKHAIVVVSIERTY